MALPCATPASITVDDHHRVSALITSPCAPRAWFVFAHSAGAGMTHPLMEEIATGLAEAGIATLRFQFPYMQAGSRRTDTPGLCHATIRAAVREAAQRANGAPLFAGGRSFGGRMSSQAQSVSALPGVLGLAFVGFPLHPAARPSQDRAQHLLGLTLPLLFLQGTRDELADPGLLQDLIVRLGTLATVKLIADADHSFRLPARLARERGPVVPQLVRTLADWMASVTTGGRSS